MARPILIEGGLQAIPNFMNPEQCNFPTLLRKLIADYNMKPLLTRPQHTFHTDGSTYFEADIDVHLFGFIGRRGFAAARYASTILSHSLALSMLASCR